MTKVTQTLENGRVITRTIPTHHFVEICEPDGVFLEGLIVPGFGGRVLDAISLPRGGSIVLEYMEGDGNARAAELAA